METDEKFDINSVMSDMLCGLDKDKRDMPISFGETHRGISINIGIDESFARVAEKFLISLFPNINIEQ